MEKTLVKIHRKLLVCFFLYTTREMFVFLLIHYLKTGKSNAFSSPNLISQQEKLQEKQSMEFCMWISEKRY